MRHHGSRPVVRTIAVLGCALGLAGCQAGDPHSDDLFGGIAGISGGYQQRAQEQQRQLNLTNQYLAGGIRPSGNQRSNTREYRSLKHNSHI